MKIQTSFGLVSFTLECKAVDEKNIMAKKGFEGLIFHDIFSLLLKNLLGKDAKGKAIKPKKGDREKFTPDQVQNGIQAILASDTYKPLAITASDFRPWAPAETGGTSRKTAEKVLAWLMAEDETQTLKEFLLGLTPDIIHASLKDIEG